MNRITLITKLRFAAVAAPCILVLVALIAAGAVHLFGGAPRAIIESDYSAIRTANGMDVALCRMDWGRLQPDGKQIVLDQERRFSDWMATARGRVTGPDQLRRLDDIAASSTPVFEAMSKALPGDDTPEPALQALEAKVADLISADEAALGALADRAEYEARVVVVTIVVGAVMIPWLCFLFVYRMSGVADAELRAMRRTLEAIAQSAPAENSQVRALDESLTRLGYPKPNPMLAEG